MPLAKIHGMVIIDGWHTEKPVNWAERESRRASKSAARESVLQ